MSLTIGFWTSILAFVEISRLASQMSWPGRTMSFGLGVTFTALFFHWNRPHNMVGSISYSIFGMAVDLALVLTWLRQLNRDVNHYHRNRPVWRMTMAGLDCIVIGVGVFALAGAALLINFRLFGLSSWWSTLHSRWLTAGFFNSRLIAPVVSF